MYDKLRFLQSVLIFAFLFSCPIIHAIGQDPKNGADGIQTGSLVATGIDSTLIDKMTKVIESNEYPNIHSVLIFTKGKLVYEHYFPGKDEIWGQPIGIVNHDRDSLHDIRSATKSVVSACIGITIGKGLIRSEEENIWKFFPEYAEFATGDKAKLTIKDLLTMSSGLDWNESIPYNDPNNSEIQMDFSSDPIRYVLSRPLAHPPGTVWNYNGGGTELLAAIIHKVSGIYVDKFAEEYLFKPLGIDHYYWTKLPSKDPNQQMPSAAAGLRLRSRDLLKFGLLYMNDGKWQGNQVIPSNWVHASHLSYINRNGPDQGYGYQFWIWNDKVGARSIHLAVAVGNGDQRIFFDHENQLLVVMTAGNYNQWTIKNNTSSLLKNFIYPAFLH